MTEKGTFFGNLCKKIYGQRLMMKICKDRASGELHFDYDGLHRVTGIKSSQWHETQKYHAHLLKERTTQDDFGKTASTYTYDARNQMLTEDGGAKHTFEYDWQGNPVTYNGHARKFSKTNSLKKAKGQRYSYNLNGNRTSDSTNSYEYDALDRLIEVKTPSGIYCYTYDALGRRTSKTHAGKTTFFLWQKDQEIGAISAEGAMEELQVLSPTNRAVAFELQGSLYVPIHDALGHVRALLDSEGNCVSTYRYSAFGEEQLQGDVLSPWRYSGKRMDVETGFVYFWKRYYDPKTLCWLTPDPIGDGDGPNYYAYVHNNPMLYSDPDGRFAAFFLLFELVSITWGATEVAVAAITIEAATKAVFAAAVVAVAVNQGANIAEDAANSESERIREGNGRAKECKAPDKPMPEKNKDPKYPGSEVDLEKNPEWNETSHPDQRKAGHREFTNGKTGERVRFDKGDPSKPGHRANDHYHRYNPNSTNNRNLYLDAYGKPTGNGSDSSHLYP